jgi:methionyl-tRNA formyltransferase
MRVVFMGSAELACPSLERLGATPGIEVVGVVTQPDRPRGRNLAVSACPVAERARQWGAAVMTPPNVNAPESVAALTALRPDLLAVVAYGQILKPAVLGLPPMGCVNLHGSLLPKYRGAAPIQWAVANGERVTGVTAMIMNERMDAGDMLLKREVEIADDDTGGTLSERMGRIGAEVLADAVLAVANGTARREPQDESQATFANKLSKEDGRINWAMPAATIHNRVRGFNPRPGCWTHLAGGVTLRVLKTRVEADETGEPGVLVAVDREGPVVAAGQGCVHLLEVQPESKRPMSGADFVRGHRLAAGIRLA